MTDLFRAFDDAVHSARKRKYRYGILGKPDGTVAVPGQTGYVYVRMDSDRSLNTARNPNAVAQSANLPVKMEEDRGVLVIVGINTGAEGAASGGVVSNPYGINKHTHAIGTGLEYEVEAERLEPGRVYPAGGLVAGVRSFRYYYNGTWETFEGGTISLGPYRPTTVGHHAWVLVGVDPGSNGIVVVAGTSQIYATALTIAQIDDIDFGIYIPCGAVKVRNDDSTVESITKYQDAHGWFADIPALIDDDDLPTAIEDSPFEGTSPYLARRDHVHNISDGYIENIKLADMAEATIRGRAVGTGTGTPVNLTAAQVVAIITTADGSGSTLDADTLDTLNSTAFFILAGQAGGQVGHGGNAANEDLTLRGTSHATKTTSYILLQPDGGNVGIGNSAPRALLDVGASAEAFAHGTASEVLGYFSQAGRSYIDIRNTADNVEVLIGAHESVMLIGTITNHPILFLENNATVARFSGGKFGIGVDPTVDLHLSKSDVNAVRFNVVNTESSSDIGFYAGGSTAFGITEWIDAAITESGSGTSGGFIFSAYTGGMKFQTNNRNTRIQIDDNGSIGFNGMSLGSGQKVLFIANAATNPSTNPSGGGILYADSGAGKWRGSGGTVTTFANAEPHCPVCGRDYMKEFDNKNYGYFAICLSCLADSLGAQPWIIRDESRLS